MLGRLRTCCLLRLDWRIFLVVGFGLVFLWPTLRTGWVNDDCICATLRGSWIFNQTSWAAETWDRIRVWVLNWGRLTPLIHLLVSATFGLLPSLAAYKWTMLGLVLVNLTVFYHFLKTVGASPNLAAVSTLMTAALIQFRMWTDPVISFGGLMQWIFLLTVLSLLLLYRYFQGGGFGYLLASLLLFLTATLTYEVAYPFCFCHAWVTAVARPGWRRGIKALAPFFAISLGLVLATLWLRTWIHYQAGPYAMILTPNRVWPTACKQFVAAVPCSFTAFYPHPEQFSVPHLFSWETLGTHWRLLAVSFLVMVPVMFGMIRSQGQVRPLLHRFGWLGLLFGLLPVPSIAVCSRYQDWLLYGVGHLPVYIQYFGMALLLSWAACALGLFLGRRVVSAAAFTLVSAFLFAAMAVFHYAANAEVVARLRVPFLFPRMEIEEVLDGGLLPAVSNKTVLLVDLNPWDLYGYGRQFYCYHTRTALKDVIPALGANYRDWLATQAHLSDEELAPPGAVRVRYFFPGEKDGFILVGSVQRVRTEPVYRNVVESAISQVRLAVWRGDGPKDLATRPFLVRGIYAHRGAESVQPLLMGLLSSQLIPLKQTRHWTIFQLPPSLPAIDGESIYLDFVTLDPEALRQRSVPAPDQGTARP